MKIITIDRAVVEQAQKDLEFFRDTAVCSADADIASAAITALRAALAEPQIDPVDEYRKGFIAGQVDMRDREQAEPAQEQVTYPTGGLQLEAGFYSADQLREMLKALEIMNAAARRAMKEMT